MIIWEMIVSGDFKDLPWSRSVFKDIQENYEDKMIVDALNPRIISIRDVRTMVETQIYRGTK